MRYAAVAQLDRVFGYEPKGRGFESLQPYQKRKTPAPSRMIFLFWVPPPKGRPPPSGDRNVWREVNSALRRGFTCGKPLRTAQMRRRPEGRSGAAVARYSISILAAPSTSEQSPLCSDVLLFLRAKRTSSARFLALPLQIEPSALGFDLWPPCGRRFSFYYQK